MKRNKTNAVLAVLMIALLLIGAVGGTLAYLKDQTAEVRNEFQPARVPSEVVEGDFDGKIKKDVVIKNNGNVPAYIRAAIVVTWKDKDGYIYPGKPEAGEDKDYVIDINTAAWTEEEGFYYYNSDVEPGETTTNLINSCNPVEGTAPEGYSLNVEILGQAIQAEGMGVTSAVNAWETAKSGN